MPRLTREIAATPVTAGQMTVRPVARVWGVWGAGRSRGAGVALVLPSRVEVTDGNGVTRSAAIPDAVLWVRVAAIAAILGAAGVRKVRR